MLDGPGTSKYCEEARPKDVNCASRSGGIDKVNGVSRSGAICLEGGIALHQGYKDVEDDEDVRHRSEVSGPYEMEIKFKAAKNVTGTIHVLL